jgi:hypothetical protein
MKAFAPSLTIAERLRAERRASFVGREPELERMLGNLDDDLAQVTFVLGSGGIGKTRLLGAFTERLEDRAVPFRVIDCESVRPTPAGFLAALAETLGCALPSVRAAAEALSELGPRVVLALDQYEKFRLLDGWLRQELLPEFPTAVKVFLFARDAAVDVWKGAPGWAALLQILRLGPLDEASSLALLARRGVASPARAELVRITRGHPLALELATRAFEERSGPKFTTLDTELGIEGLAPLLLRTVQDEALRALLEAACLGRRATKSVLAAMVPSAFDEARFEALQALPFVELARDGLVIHEAVRTAIAASLCAVEPRRYQELRSRAWGCLREELTVAGKPQLWRYMADVLYLVDRPEIREGLFPGEGAIYGLESARPGDAESILDLVRVHDPGDLEPIRLWWRALPGSFRVLRGDAGSVRGFYALALARDVPAELIAADPLLAAWFADLRAARVPSESPVFFARRLLVVDTGEGPSRLRSALWLDAKRAYLEQPEARRIYIATREPDEHWSLLGSLGFAAPASLRVECGGAVFGSLVLDFGTRGVLGWLAGLLDAQFEACVIDEKARALIVDGRRVPLTKLEFGVLVHLRERKDQVVPRDQLLREVWGQSFGGSNVVDAVVKSLRKKLGARSGLIETVTGHGYRLSDFELRVRSGAA